MAYLGSTIAALLAFKGAQVHFILRPVAVTFFLFALVLVVVRGYHRSPAHYRAIYLALPLLFVLWANVHPSFVLGLLYLVLASAPILLRNGGGLGRYEQFFVVLLSILASGFNPYGFALHASILQFGAEPYFARYHGEWRPLQFGSFEGRIGVSLVILAIIGLAHQLRRGPVLKTVFGELPPLIVFALLALWSVRFLPYAVIAAAAPAAYATIPCANFCYSRLRSLFLELQRGESRYAGCVVALLAIMILPTSALMRGSLLLFDGPFEPRAGRSPRVAIETLKLNASPGSPIVLASRADWGGLITLYGYPAVQAVIDDRNTMIGAAFYRAYDSEMQPTENWRSLLTQLGATHLLLATDDALARAILQDALLPIVYQDQIGVVFGLAP